MRGFDCSGFVIEILKSVGVLPRAGDWAATGLLQMFNDEMVDVPFEGCLVFWENRWGSIVHVEYCLDERFAIGASGGGSGTTNRDVAISKNAFVKIRPIKSRSLIAGYVDPFM